MKNPRNNIIQLGKKFEVKNHILKFGEKPERIWPTIYHVELRYRDKPDVFDRLWVVVNSPDSKIFLDAWVVVNDDTSWMNNLPKVYPAIQMHNLEGIDPEKGAPNLWEEPKRKTSLFHHSAGDASLGVVRCEMLTEQLPGGHGNQAWYDGNGALIEAPPILAGRPKKFALNNPDDPHLKMYNRGEAIPFILAAQLDGNPAHGIETTLEVDFSGIEPNPNGNIDPAKSRMMYIYSYNNLNRPCIYLGDNLNEYLGKRPAHPTGVLQP
jgi:hypothetical protein